MAANEAVYRIYTRIERIERRGGEEGYRAVAVALADGQPLRCAPPSREARCSRPDHARRLAFLVAGQLATDLARRGLKCAP